MSDHHRIVREIGIDAGHRVTYHGSKCRNLHGHRYTVQAECEGPLFAAGEQQGMVLDFGFLKTEMMSEIDQPCDHGLILWIDDPLADAIAIAPKFGTFAWEEFRAVVMAVGHLEVPHAATGKLYLVPFVPTAENLARHWFQRLAPRVRERSDGAARLTRITVQETPNCSASYSGSAA